MSLTTPSLLSTAIGVTTDFGPAKPATQAVPGEAGRGEVLQNKGAKSSGSAAHPPQCFPGVVTQFSKVLGAEVGKFVLFPVRPQIFHWIQLRSTGGQELQPDTPPLLAYEVPDQTTAMASQSIPNHQQLAGNVAQPMREELDHLRTADAARKQSEKKFHHVTPAMADSVFQLKWYCSTEVWPRGAQVRQRCGRSLSPLSSMKTMVRPSFLAFFLTLAALLLPVPDLLLVSFQGASRRSRATPTQLPQDAPGLRGIVLHLAFVLDQVGDT